MIRLGGTMLSVVAAAIVISIIGSVCDGKNSTGRLVRMIGGVVLSVHLLSGIMEVDFSRFTSFTEEIFRSGDAAAASGSFLASEATAEIIKAETEAYILDKADDLGAEIRVEVFLTSDGITVPDSLRIWGRVSPYARNTLEQMIESDLGIAKEKQEWIGWN